MLTYHPAKNWKTMLRAPYMLKANNQFHLATFNHIMFDENGKILPEEEQTLDLQISGNFTSRPANQAHFEDACKLARSADIRIREGKKLCDEIGFGYNTVIIAMVADNRLTACMNYQKFIELHMAKKVEVMSVIKNYA